jgi:hypothetical protein
MSATELSITQRVHILYVVVTGALERFRVRLWLGK